MLKFIGSGSAFNTDLGNNSAYIKDDGVLFLIDCGSSTFSKIIGSDLLDDVKQINVLITHTHPDHVGSLGDLAFYSYYNIPPMFQRKLCVYAHSNHHIEDLLWSMGVTTGVYELIDFYETQTITEGKFNIDFTPIEVTHVKELDCYGYILRYKNELAYYSGDSNMIPDEIVEMQENGKFDYFYQDTCSMDYAGNVHLSMNKLCERFEPYYRKNIWCMHIDNKFDANEARMLGFNVVKNDF